MEAVTTKRSTKNRFFADRAHLEIIETAHMVTVLKINNGFKQLSIFAKKNSQLRCLPNSEYATEF